jgi:hypothetical protein
MSTSAHEDAASTISVRTARQLLEEPTEKGRRLLELFARAQVLELDTLREEFATNQNGLNALLGALTLRFQEIQGDPGFYIYIPKLRAWAIGSRSQRNLRQAIRAIDASRQGELSFR